MSYSNHEEFVFEYERATNKEQIIHYDIKSMATDCVALDELVSRVFIASEIGNLITPTHGKKRQTAELRMKRNLRSILWHLFQAQRIDRDVYVRIPLHNSAYTGRDVRNPFRISREVRNIVHVLDEQGYVEKHIGYYTGCKDTSRYTRIRATLRLLAELRKLPSQLNEEDVAIAATEFRKIIRTKRQRWSKEKNRMISYTHVEKQKIEKPFDCPQFRKAERVVHNLNAALAQHKLTIKGLQADYLTWKDEDGSRRRVNLNRKAVSAIFHIEEREDASANASLSSRFEANYGRVHGGFWQAMPSDFRPLIEIDGKPTVELDYSAQVLNMAASDAGLQLIGDPYAFDIGISFLEREVQRSIVKSCIVIMMNTTSKRSAAFAAMKCIEDEGWWNTTARELDLCFVHGFFKSILARHPYLNRYVFKGRGKRFFHRDSVVARRVIELMLEAGKIVLPIHDGFVACEEDVQFLRSAMETAWHESFGTDILIK